MGLESSWSGWFQHIKSSGWYSKLAPNEYVVMQLKLFYFLKKERKNTLPSADNNKKNIIKTINNILSLKGQHFYFR